MTAQPPRPRSVRAAPAAGLGADAGLVSGEAVELDIRVARLGSRVLALLIDVLVQVLVALLLAAVLTLTFGALVAGDIVDLPDLAVTRGLQTVLAVLVLIGYPVLFETFNHGRSIGKLAVGLRVIRDDGGPVGFRQASTRALVGVAVEWPGLVLPLLTWVAGVAVMLSDARGRRLGDLAAGTLVIHERSPSAAHYRPFIITPALVSWARTLDLTRLDDGLALAVRQLLSRGPTLVDSARRQLAASLWVEVASVTSPPPPPGLPEWAYLTAVLTERHHRARQRLARSRSVTAALWPELAPDGGPAPTDSGSVPSDGGQVAASGAETTPSLTVRPAAPSASAPSRPVASPITGSPWPAAPAVLEPAATAWSAPVPAGPGTVTLPSTAAAQAVPPTPRRPGTGQPVESEWADRPLESEWAGDSSR
ncbi:RDD family protein [Plantactinospora sonchi]|uniref:RDD family protein n=1 Tax=Plantactinospora sonchi TaxID=1544735 RepID=A0ABU7RLZ5_9ACTN